MGDRASAATDKLFSVAPMQHSTAPRPPRPVRPGAGRATATMACFYLEYRESEQISLDDGRIRSAGFDTSGLGLACVAGEATGYTPGRSERPAARREQRGSGGGGPFRCRRGASACHQHAALLGRQSAWRDRSFPHAVGGSMPMPVAKMRVSSGDGLDRGEWQAVQTRPDGIRVADLRPLVRLNVSLVVEKDGRRETGSYGTGGRFAYDRVTAPAVWRGAVDERCARRWSIWKRAGSAGRWRWCSAPAGRHPAARGDRPRRSGDFNRKKTSAFAGLLGSRIAVPGVTVVDDGTLPDRRGSLTVDDEGTPTSRTVLIEDGVLGGFMQDRLNARLMGMPATGNGRRQSYAHAPMPRMTNTVMLAGPHAPDEMIRSVRRGLYAVNFGGGQVDITSGKFVFSASEAYLIRTARSPPGQGRHADRQRPDA
jgi:TldD protein